MPCHIAGRHDVIPFPVPAIRITAFCELLGAIPSHAHLREPRNVALTVAMFIAPVTVATGRALGA
jgi:hypothetical protein